jgi:hypothetical protein
MKSIQTRCRKKSIQLFIPDRSRPTTLNSAFVSLRDHFALSDIKEGETVGGRLYSTDQRHDETSAWSVRQVVR